METSPLWRHRLTRQAGVSTILLSGELDLACVATLQALMFEQIQAPAVAEVQVDLAEVDFLDSSALGVLVSGLNFAQDQGRSFRVVNSSPAAQRILAVTGLQDILTAD